MPLWLHRIIAILPIAALIGAGWVIHLFLAEHSYDELTASVDSVAWQAIALALLATAASFLVLTLYDVMAARYAGADLKLGRILLGAPIVYAFSNSLGVSMLTSGALRLRLYGSAGGAAIARMTAFSTLTLWLGPLALAPIALATVGQTETAIAAGVVAAMLISAYVTSSWWWARPLSAGGANLTAPSPGVALGQLVLSLADWLIAGLVLVALVPGEVAAPGTVLAAFLIAQTLGLFSHLPGGIGVFEAAMVALAAPEGGAAALAGPLLVYRAVYYLVPLALAALSLGAAEIWERRTLVAGARRFIAPGLRYLTPPLLALAAFAVGVVLLISAVTPGVAERLATLDDFLPIEVIEASHLVSVAAGIALLFLARGLARRRRDAFHVTLVMLGVGALASLLKGADYEEAILAALALALMWPARPFFHRRADRLDLSLTPLWLTVIAITLGISVWLGFYVFRDVPYETALFTTAAIDNDAGRFLRALVLGAALVFSALIIWLLSLRRPGRDERPSAADIDDAVRIAASVPETGAQLALLGDKRFLFDDAKTGFIMFADSGRSRVALGDPVAPSPKTQRELLWRFLEECDAADRWPVFYEASQDLLPLYLDAGLSAHKLGEEAIVDLVGFTLAGGRMAGLRQGARAAERKGLIFSVVAADAVPALIAEMKAVSDAWLAKKKSGEKGFSLGRFDPAYLARYPAALVRDGDGRLLAFANLWPGADKAELSVDLMRHVPHPPQGLMDLLFSGVLLWGQAEGYRRFNLGMAPMSGLSQHRLAPLWQRAGSYIFSRWGALYDFQGLRAYKQKFSPRWEARYLISPGGAPLARVLLNVTALVSGGLLGAIRK
ncbi:MAG: bifunctional lysylphosphatidylglycerol flippase/synthetase MprF [Micropepsaceae bacterium]